MASEDLKTPGGDRHRMNELKASLASLSPAERIAQEIRLAREQGITVTASEAARIGRPIEGMVRLKSQALHAADHAPHEPGQSADLGMRQTAGSVLRASPFMPASPAGAVRDMLKTLGSGHDVDALVTRLDPLLTLLAATGEHEDLIREAKTVFARTVFSSSDPMRSRKGAGGEPNT